MIHWPGFETASVGDPCSQSIPSVGLKGNKSYVQAGRLVKSTTSVRAATLNLIRERIT